MDSIGEFSNWLLIFYFSSNRQVKVDNLSSLPF
jgi:hypothetical protein